MIRYLMDTDTFTLYLRHDLSVFTSVLRYLPQGVSVPIIVVEELWDGWQSVIRKAKTPDAAGIAYQRLADTLTELQNWSIVPFSKDAIQIYQRLKQSKLNVGSNDLKIAACALSAEATLVTGNTRDFSRVGGLALVDWSGRESISE